MAYYTPLSDCFRYNPTGAEFITFGLLATTITPFLLLVYLSSGSRSLLPSHIVIVPCTNHKQGYNFDSPIMELKSKL